MKFGLVGVIAFIIDWGILNLLVGVFRMHNVLAATISFVISLIFNYVASMKLVFKHRDDMARWMEILIFRDWRADRPVHERRHYLDLHVWHEP